MKFTETHEWINMDNTPAVIGITNHAQSLLGDLVFVELPEEGQTVSAGDEVGVLESVKAASDLYAPISGTVVAVNRQATEDPALINRDAEGDGWLFKLEVTDTNELTRLLDDVQYKDMIAEDK